MWYYGKDFGFTVNYIVISVSGVSGCYTCYLILKTGIFEDLKNADQRMRDHFIEMRAAAAVSL